MEYSSRLRIQNMIPRRATDIFEGHLIGPGDVSTTLTRAEGKRVGYLPKCFFTVKYIVFYHVFYRGVLKAHSAR